MKDGIEFAEKNGMFFIETSAKTADNINELFEVLLTFTCFQLKFNFKMNQDVCWQV